MNVMKWCLFVTAVFFNTIRNFEMVKQHYWCQPSIWWWDIQQIATILFFYFEFLKAFHYTKNGKFNHRFFKFISISVHVLWDTISRINFKWNISVAWKHSIILLWNYWNTTIMWHSLQIFFLCCSIKYSFLFTLCMQLFHCNVFNIRIEKREWFQSLFF